MNPNTFQFSRAARLYCENVSLIDEIGQSSTAEAKSLYDKYEALISEMRDEAYRNIAMFAELILGELSRLPLEAEGRCLCSKKTYTVKRWRGVSINYRCMKPRADAGRFGKGEPCIAIGVPLPGVIREIGSDSGVRGQLDVITKQRLSVGLVCETDDEPLRRRVAMLAKSPAFGECPDFKANGGWNNLLMQIDAENPVGRIVERLTVLLRAIHEIDHSRL